MKFNAVVRLDDYDPQHAMTLLRRYLRDEDGEGAIEYGLLACMIACFVLTAVQKIGVNLSTKLKVLSNAFS